MQLDPDLALLGRQQLDKFAKLTAQKTPAALDMLAALKGRGRGAPFLVLVADLEQALDLVVLEAGALKLARRFWPGPLSIVAPSRVELPPQVMGPDSRVGIRVSSHPVAGWLAAACGPVTSTSANLHGEPPAVRLEQVPRTILEQCLVVTGGPEPAGGASTVVAMNEGGDVEILRDGALSREQLLDAL